MKLNLVSLVSFFTIANIVNGQFLRVDKEQQNRVTTVQEQDAKLAAKLDLVDNGADLEYFDDGDGIISMGTGANDDVKKMDPSGEAAPTDLVNAQNATSIDDDLRTKTLTYNHCKEYYSLTGFSSYLRDTTRMAGQVFPIRGCVSIKSTKWNGYQWLNIGGTRRVCAGWTDIARVPKGPFMTYSVDVFNADGDKYDMLVCWD